MNFFLKTIIAQMFFICLFFNIYAQVKTKTFADSIPNHLIPVNGLNLRKLNIEVPAEFYKLRQQKDSNKKGLYKFALPSLVSIDLFKELLLQKTMGFQHTV